MQHTNLKKRFIFNQLAFAICLLFFAACESPSAFEENTTLNTRGWFYKDTISFKAEITEIDSPYNVFINLRHTNEYPKSNLWIKIVTTFPDGKTEVAPLNIPMADPDGKWHGKGLGSILSNQIQIQKNAVFQQAGIYEFELIQDMRVNPVTEILDVGLQIDKVAE